MRLAYTIIYVPDVLEALAFYEKAFGIKTKFIHESKVYAELDTGSATLSFLSETRAEEHGMKFIRNRSGSTPAGIEVAFEVEDVSVAFKKAVAAGAKASMEPVDQPWGQTISYVTDLNGVLVELCSKVA